MALEDPLSNFEPVVEDAPFPGVDNKPPLLWRREWYSWLSRLTESIRNSFSTIEATIDGLVTDVAGLVTDVAGLTTDVANRIVGPGSATDNAVVRFDSTTGKLAQNSAFVVDDNGHVTSFGGQLVFPATQSASAGANTLDDYEEGTFTPAIAFGGSSSGVTYSSQLGRYTKIGRVVLFSLRVNLTNNGTGTGNATITGLPFTSASTPAAALSMWASNITQGGVAAHYQPLIEVSSTTITLYYNSTGTAAVLQDTNVSNTADIIISGHYTVG